LPPLGKHVQVPEVVHEVMDGGDGQSKMDLSAIVLLNLLCQDSSFIIFLIDTIHALNLLSGSWMRSRRKLMNHSKMVFCSLSNASEWSLFLASIISRGIG
jgi:hypothetical protein